MHLFERLIVRVPHCNSEFPQPLKRFIFHFIGSFSLVQKAKSNTSTALDLYVRQSKRAPSIHTDKVSDSKKKEGKKIETETRDHPMDLRFVWQRGIQVGKGIEAEIFFIIGMAKR